MTFNRAPGRVRTAALLAGVLCASLPACAADLASTYAPEAFPSGASAETPRQPCRQARLRRSRGARKPAGGALRHGSGSPELLPAERIERPGVLTNEEDPKHS
ncbi:MAG TPA: hypothetical protein VE007_10665 [Thermoanaerobaculia bacterium]|nr:hypothetical protein [Thermoanaerobaculia bacterium]